MKWDHTGIVVETKPHDQYVVKVSGSGRLTLRNRRFLRRYQSHDLHQTNTAPDVPQADPIPVEITQPVVNETYQPTTTQVVNTGHHTISPAHSPLSTRTQAPATPVLPVPPPQLGDTSLSFGSVAPPLYTETESSEPVVFAPRRSSRNRAARKTYDADSGSDVTPTSVPETI